MSASSFRVGLANSFNSIKHNTTIDVGSTDPNATTNTLLHQREKACLEYFLALIQLRSQKQLPNWAILLPLAHHCKGYLQTGNKNPLLSAGCNVKTAWARLDKIFEQCTPALMSMIKSQLTITCVIDNWQRLINKLWQDMGKSSLFQRGTSFLSSKTMPSCYPCSK